MDWAKKTAEDRLAKAETSEIDLKTLPSLGTAANLFPKLPTEALASDYAFATDGYFAGLIANAGFGGGAPVITDGYHAPDLNSVATSEVNFAFGGTPANWIDPNPTNAGFGILSTLGQTPWRNSLPDAPPSTNGSYGGNLYTPWAGNSAHGVQGGLDEYLTGTDRGRDTGDNLRSDLKRTYGTAKTPTSLLPPGTMQSTYILTGDPNEPAPQTPTRRPAVDINQRNDAANLPPLRNMNESSETDNNNGLDKLFDNRQDPAAQPAIPKQEPVAELAQGNALPAAPRNDADEIAENAEPQLQELPPKNADHEHSATLLVETAITSNMIAVEAVEMLIGTNAVRSTTNPDYVRVVAGDDDDYTVLLLKKTGYYTNNSATAARASSGTAGGFGPETWLFDYYEVVQEWTVQNTFDSYLAAIGSLLTVESVNSQVGRYLSVQDDKHAQRGLDFTVNVFVNLPFVQSADAILAYKNDPSLENLGRLGVNLLDDAAFAMSLGTTKIGSTVVNKAVSGVSKLKFAQSALKAGHSISAVRAVTLVGHAATAGQAVVAAGDGYNAYKNRDAASLGILGGQALVILFGVGRAKLNKRVAEAKAGKPAPSRPKPANPDPADTPDLGGTGKPKPNTNPEQPEAPSGGKADDTELNGKRTPNKRRLFHEEDFNTEVLDSGNDLVGHNVNYNGPENQGFMQTTFTRSSRDLYIDTTRTKINGQGLGEEMLRRAIASAESEGSTVKTISGNLLHANRDILLRKGLEETPAYKIRVRNGFTKVLVQPTMENNYLLVMGK